MSIPHGASSDNSFELPSNWCAQFWSEAHQGIIAHSACCQIGPSYEHNSLGARLLKCKSKLQTETLESIKETRRTLRKFQSDKSTGWPPLVATGRLRAKILNESNKPPPGTSIIPETRRKLRRAQLLRQAVTQGITCTPARSDNEQRCDEKKIANRGTKKNETHAAHENGNHTDFQRDEGSNG